MVENLIYFLFVFCFAQSLVETNTLDNFKMPDESQLHLRTWMGFPSSYNIWGNLLSACQNDIARIAKFISKHEPVNILVSSISNWKILKKKLSEINVESHYNITPILNPINDLWLRDSGPTFVKNFVTNERKAIDFNFNGWGNKQVHNFDVNVAKFIGQYLNLEVIKSNIVIEGGAIEVDGEGTAIIAESCVINNNRNSGMSKNFIESELKRVLGLEKIIWIPGIRDMDITDGHTDFYVRFVGNHKPATVFVHIDPQDSTTYEALSIIQYETDAKGRKLTPIIINAPNNKKIRSNLQKSKKAALGYVNFYVGNNAVYCPEFGDREADQNVYNILSENYPGRIIEQISIDNIALGGGGIHCTTQQEPIY